MACMHQQQQPHLGRCCSWASQVQLLLLLMMLPIIILLAGAAEGMEASIDSSTGNDFGPWLAHHNEVVIGSSMQHSPTPLPVTPLPYMWPNMHSYLLVQECRSHTCIECRHVLHTLFGALSS